MPRFDSNNVKELREYIYNNSYAHDAIIENIIYNFGTNLVVVELLNPFLNIRSSITFCNIDVALAIKGSEYGSNDTIVSLTVEEDYSYLHNYLSERSVRVENSIYILFQMFSGSEMHIVAKDVIVEAAKR